MTILTQLFTLILVLDIHDNSVEARHFFELSVYYYCIFCENTADFDKFKYYGKLIAGNNSNLRRIVVGIKHQNLDIKSGRNKISLMEGTPSIS